MRREKLWVYSILPIIVLNLGAMFIFGAYYAVAATRPEWVAGFGQGQLSFVLFVFVSIVEWILAASVIFRLKLTGTRYLIAPGPALLFRRLPALFVFAALNTIFIAYVLFVSWVYGSWHRIEGLAIWQMIVMLAGVPITAGFCEELVWRGYIITRLQAQGAGSWKAILLSAVSFALIHGLVLPDRLLVTFLFGVVAGFYFVKERNLVPLIMTHIVVDMWSFGLSLG